MIFLHLILAWFGLFPSIVCYRFLGFIGQSVKPLSSRDELKNLSEQSKDQQIQQNHWLSNLLPQGAKSDSNSTDGSPVRTREDNNTSPRPNSTSDIAELQRAVSSPQQKPVNLLPEVPMQTSRKLSDREQRDCDVIGE